uniref:Uncharacterized protein n=1 Tax=Oryza barthii TaxID=65489 RepID=A0A0D3F636_9ORYZ
MGRGCWAWPIPQPLLSLLLLRHPAPRRRPPSTATYLTPPPRFEPNRIESKMNGIKEMMLEGL